VTTRRGISLPEAVSACFTFFWRLGGRHRGLVVGGGFPLFKGDGARGAGALYCRKNEFELK